MLLALKKKAKKYLRDSVDFIQDELDASNDNNETCIYRINSGNQNFFLQPNIQRSHSAIDIPRNTQVSIYQIPVSQPNNCRINSCSSVNQRNLFPYIQNSNFNIVNPGVRNANFYHSNNTQK